MSRTQMGRLAWNEITGIVIGSAVTVHDAFGPGLLESAYQAALECELQIRGLRVETQVPVQATYKGRDLGVVYRADLLVEDRILLEIKALEELHPVHARQLLTYLKATNNKLGLLINFGGKKLSEGIVRALCDFFFFFVSTHKPRGSSGKAAPGWGRWCSAWPAARCRWW